MGKIFYIIGRSASGKDKLFRALLRDQTLALKEIVLYTTRPIREKETQGNPYHFVTDEVLSALAREGKVIEEREYDTVHGIWRYATVDDGSVDLSLHDYVCVGTLASYQKMKARYGKEILRPIYIEVREDLLLERALRRERKQSEPKYKEMCRRFLSDSKDFSEEKIREAGITRRFENNETLDDVLRRIRAYIIEEKG